MRPLPPALRDIPADVPGLWDTLTSRFANLGRPPRVVIHGGYGKNNMGDDALLHVIRGRVLAALPTAEVHVVCHGPERVVARYRDDPAGPVTSSHFKSRATIRAARRSDLYIIGGGGIVNRINAYSGLMMLKWLDPKGKFQFLAALLAGWTGGVGARPAHHREPARAGRQARDRTGARPRALARTRACRGSRQALRRGRSGPA